MLEKRREVYIKILDPYIKLFAETKSQNKQEAIQNAIKIVTSYNYRKIAFELMLFGSDEVAKAFVELASITEEKQKNNPLLIIMLFGNLLLEIRKSLGNKKTNLECKDMLKCIINDIDKYNLNF